MSKFLKGNYKLKKGTNKPKNKKNTSFSNMFENRAMEKLGGSIAFVMKEDSFLWSEANEAVKE